jgi:hypothetical protein
MRLWICGLAAAVVGLAAISPATAEPFFFSTNGPDAKMAMASRPNSPGKIEIETGDDFVLTKKTAIDSATFTGLITDGVPLSSIGPVHIEIYRVFPLDSNTARTPNVPTRVNSPSDVAFDSRDSTAGTLSFSTTGLDASFTVANSVLNGIHPKPNQTTGGEGPVTGQEVLFSVIFNTPFVLQEGHYFFVPQVQVNDANGQFYWLSAPKPITPPGTPFSPDLQAWIRNADLDPDWLRVGTDIVGKGAFNATFSLSGQVIPEPASLTLLGLGGLILAGAHFRHRRIRPS